LAIFFCLLLFPNLFIGEILFTNMVSIAGKILDTPPVNPLMKFAQFVQKIKFYWILHLSCLNIDNSGNCFGLFCSSHCLNRVERKCK
jgi:hypothetical protein